MTEDLSDALGGASGTRGVENVNGMRHGHRLKGQWHADAHGLHATILDHIRHARQMDVLRYINWMKRKAQCRRSAKIGMYGGEEGNSDGVLERREVLGDVLDDGAAIDDLAIVQVGIGSKHEHRLDRLEARIDHLQPKPSPTH